LAEDFNVMGIGHFFGGLEFADWTGGVKRLGDKPRVALLLQLILLITGCHIEY
jgi:hypothetical protein